MSIFYKKDYFATHKWKTYGCLRKIQLTLVYSAWGLLLMPLIDLMLKVEAFGILLSLPLICCQGSRRFRVFMESVYYRLFGLNIQEVEQFEKQKKISQLIFEDLPMLFLNIFIFSETIYAPAIHK